MSTNISLGRGNFGFLSDSHPRGAIYGPPNRPDVPGWAEQAHKASVFYSGEPEAEVDLLLSATAVHSDGGYDVVGQVLAGLADGRYFVHLGSSSGARCSATVEPYEDVIEVSMSVFQLVTPPFAVGGPYRLYFEDITSGVISQSIAILQVVPHEYRDRVAGTRSLAPPQWSVGWRRPGDESPQT